MNNRITMWGPAAVAALAAACAEAPVRSRFLPARSEAEARPVVSVRLHGLRPGVPRDPFRYPVCSWVRIQCEGSPLPQNAEPDEPHDACTPPHARPGERWIWTSQGELRVRWPADCGLRARIVVDAVPEAVTFCRHIENAERDVSIALTTADFDLRCPAAARL